MFFLPSCFSSMNFLFDPFQQPSHTHSVELSWTFPFFSLVLRFFPFFFFCIGNSSSPNSSSPNSRSRSRSSSLDSPTNTSHLSANAWHQAVSICSCPRFSRAPKDSIQSTSPIYHPRPKIRYSSACSDILLLSLGSRPPLPQTLVRILGRDWWLETILGRSIEKQKPKLAGRLLSPHASKGL